MKKNLVLLLPILAIVLIAVFYLPKHRSKTEIPEKRLFNFNENQAVAWKVWHSNVFLHVIKSNGNWYDIAQGTVIDLENDSAFANVKNFNTIDTLSSLGTFSNMAELGFSPTNNKYDLILEDLEGKKTIYSFYSGDLLPTSNGYYFYQDSSETNLSETNVYAVEAWVVKALQKKLDAIRDKNFIDAGPEEIVYVQFNNMTITKNELNWRVNLKPVAQSDTTKIDALAYDIAYFKADKVSTVAPVPLSNISPITVTLALKKKSEAVRDLRFSVYSLENESILVPEDSELYYYSDEPFSEAITMEEEYFLKERL